MRRIIILIIFPFIINAQNTHEINWKSNFIIESNGLNKEFLNTALYGGNITDSIKNIWINSSKENNIINAEISNGIEYIVHFKNRSIGFSFTDMNIFNTRFTKDILALSLKGNFDYQDKTLEFGGTNIRADRFQKYTLIYARKTNNFKIQTGFSYLAGNHHLSYIIEHGNLYTAPGGNYLDIEYDMNGFITDTSDFSLFLNNGNGVAMDLGIDFNIQKYNLNFSINNLGFIMWNTQSIVSANDSIFRFEGVEIEDIYNFNDSILETYNIIDDLKKTNNTSFKSYIPATIHLSFSGSTNYKYLENYTTGIIRKWQPYMDNTPLSFEKIQQGIKESNFSVLYYVKSNFRTQYFNINPSLSYGGYSNEYNIGLALSLGNKNKLIFGTYHLEEMFNKEDAKALSFYFNIHLQF